MPAGYPSGASFFAVTVRARAGSIADFGTSTSDILAAGDWAPLLTAAVTTTNALAALPGLAAPIVVPAGTKLAFWFLFTDGTRPMRPALPKQTSGYNFYAASADGALNVSYAMQVRQSHPFFLSLLLEATRHALSCMVACLPAWPADLPSSWGCEMSLWGCCAPPELSLIHI